MPEPAAVTRVLVTGSRDWDDYLAIEKALHGEYFRDGRSPYGPMIVVHGSCSNGADAMADRITRRMMAAGFWVAPEPHPADWERHGRRAGFIRNAEMVALGAGICLAFIKDGSRGASHCAALAENAGIPVRRFTP